MSRRIVLAIDPPKRRRPLPAPKPEPAPVSKSINPLLSLSMYSDDDDDSDNSGNEAVASDSHNANSPLLQTQGFLSADGAGRVSVSTEPSDVPFKDEAAAAVALDHTRPDPSIGTSTAMDSNLLFGIQSGAVGHGSSAPLMPFAETQSASATECIQAPTEANPHGQWEPFWDENSETWIYWNWTTGSTLWASPFPESPSALLHPRPGASIFFRPTPYSFQTPMQPPPANSHLEHTSGAVLAKLDALVLMPGAFTNDEKEKIRVCKKEYAVRRWDWGKGALKDGYFAEITTHWEAVVASLEAYAAPATWRAIWDASSMTYYYIQESTGLTSWTLPEQGLPSTAEPPPPPPPDDHIAPPPPPPPPSTDAQGAGEDMDMSDGEAPSPGGSQHVGAAASPPIKRLVKKVKRAHVKSSTAMLLDKWKQVSEELNRPEDESEDEPQLDLQEWAEQQQQSTSVAKHNPNFAPLGERKKRKEPEEAEGAEGSEKPPEGEAPTPPA
ncbi:uncharacterized protein BJ171DRAFT_581239 [Polychytrium aggregatum]|uniref:uncharacterized protein n=1 Tax=Polychytrium aggregatum TaxID=110093 RepID=UPI0022FE92E3|nr:uncharacterized protein BJ171DRAFT_581239 [Polychytrium aggregatum]KAI9205027.1 hypothetical protein BJ171DRAFT_581239 [Polychytrium aggregatum]